MGPYKQLSPIKAHVRPTSSNQSAYHTPVTDTKKEPPTISITNVKDEIIAESRVEVEVLKK